MFTLADPLHFPTAYIREARVVVDGDCDFVQFGTRFIVTIPEGGIGSVGEYEDRADAAVVLAAYRTPGATRETVLRARASIGCEWAAELLAELAAAA